MNTPNQQLSNFWKANSSLLTKAIAALLFIFALYILAKLIWLWVDFSQPKQIDAGGEVIKTSSKKRVSINRVAQMHLFGEAGTEEVVEEVTGETALNLKLIGVYVDSNDQLSSAIIRSGANKEYVYWIGDKIKGVSSRNVELKKVEPLRVIIRNGAKNETLTLLEKLNQDVLNSKSKLVRNQRQSSDKTIDKRRDSRLTKDLKDMREKLSESPQSFVGLAKFEAVIDDGGQVAGFKVAPGKDPRMFSRLGLRRNDVIKSVNGSGLSNNGYFTVLEQLQTADTLEVSIERNGQPITLLLNLGSQQQPDRDANRARNTTRDVKIQ